MADETKAAPKGGTTTESKPEANFDAETLAQLQKMDDAKKKDGDPAPKAKPKAKADDDDEEDADEGDDAKDEADEEPAKKKAKAAESDADHDDDEKPSKKKSKADADDDEEDEENETPKAKAKDDDEEDAEEDAEKDAEKDAEPKKKAEDAEKGLEAIHKEKKRWNEERRRKDAEAESKLAERTRLAEARERDFETKVAGLKAKVDEFELLQARVKSSPRAAVALLRRLNLPADAWEHVANAAFAMKPDASAEWKSKYGMDDGGAETEIEAMRRKQAEQDEEIARLKRERTAETTRADVEQKIAGFIAEVAESADAEEHPNVRRLLKKNPERARKRLREAGDELANKTRRKLSPVEVVEALEQRLREDAEDLAEAPTKSKPNAEKTKTAPEKLAKSKPRDDSDDEDDEDDEDILTNDAAFERFLDKRDKAKAAKEAKKKKSA